MLARLWWKDLRQFWPIGAVLAAFAVVVQGLLIRYGGPEIRHGGLAALALLWTALYAFAVSAASFAGERENRTLVLLDALPVGRGRLWGAKVSFALATTTLLGLVLLGVAALSTTRWEVGSVGPAFVFLISASFVLEMLGWGFFFSSMLQNALVAAVLAIVCLTVAVPTIRQNSALDLHTEVENIPFRLAVALATLAASAFVMTFRGPPIRSPRKTRAIGIPWPSRPERASAIPARPRFWPHAIRSLAWETVRLGRASWLIYLAVLLVYSLLCLTVWRTNGSSWTPLLFLEFFVGLFAGVGVFNAENRTRTHRFLANHGVRPGVIWAVKMGIWLGVLTVFVWLPAMLFVGVWQISGMGRGASDLINIPLAFAAVLSSGFAVGQFCGMVIHRGITAVTAATMLYFVLVMPLTGLSGVNMISPLFVALVPIGLLFITWAWSGDWLLARPGWGKWLRLGTLVSAISIAWSLGYIGDRAWGVPRLESASEAALNRLVEPATRSVSHAENAAELYRQAGSKLLFPPVNPAGSAPDRGPNSGQTLYDVDRVILEGWDPKSKQAVDWLKSNTEAIALTREAARRPDCQFAPLARASITDPLFGYQQFPFLGNLIALSAREKMSNRDIPGAWADILTLFHMVRHATGPMPLTLEHSGLTIERRALTLAIQWAADERQTSSSLKAALADFEGFPHPSIGESLAVELLLIRNLLAKPRDDLVAEVSSLYWQGSSYRKAEDRPPLQSLSVQAMTTPWEVERTRRLSEQMASELIGYATSDPYARPHSAEPHYRIGAVSAWEINQSLEFSLRFAERTTPLLRLMAASPGGMIALNDRNEVARRALPTVLALRIYQAEHDGDLPVKLTEIMTGEKPILPRYPIDPYAGKPFGYTPSNGQSLLPLGRFDPLISRAPHQGPSFVATRGCMLLFSPGPDLQTDFAGFNDATDDIHGDIVFPIKDHVKPPAEAKGPKNAN